MEAFKVRVIDEQAALEEKINALEKFMHNSIYAELPPVEQGLLMVQFRAMKMYNETLNDRIARF